MPSRQPQTTPPPPQVLLPPPHPRPAHHLRHLHPFLILAVAVLVSAAILATAVLLFLRCRRGKRASLPSSRPPPLHPLSPEHGAALPKPSSPGPQRFTYDQLRRATADFSPSNKLGRGGFGSVFRGALLGPGGEQIAIKLMDSGSLQGEREFLNELALAAFFMKLGTTAEDNVVFPIGFCSEDEQPGEGNQSSNHKKRGIMSNKNRKKHRWFDGIDDDGDDEDGEFGAEGEGVRRRVLVLVYELLQNGNLQSALLDRKCPELMDWGRRFAVALDVARGLLYLHTKCDPPIVHGDIKPSNVLLDSNFSAKIADFGLARPLVLPDSPPLISPSNVLLGNGSPESEKLVSPVLSPVNYDVASTSETGGFDKVSVDSELEARRRKKNGGFPGKDWWSRQDGDWRPGPAGAGVKDYVMEWIGSEIPKDKSSRGNWISSDAALPEPGTEQMRRLDWWPSLDQERTRRKKEDGRKIREWWREEFCDELVKKNSKQRQRKQKVLTMPKSSSCSIGAGNSRPQKDDDSFGNGCGQERKPKRKKKSWSRGGGDWCSDSLGGCDVRSTRRQRSQDWASGEISKSGGMSSTPSVRGTVCYVAPECGGGGGGSISEKCDIYSFGVLLLVLISGRRPLQVTGSPVAEFERANLVSWGRQLARAGKLLDLLDPSLQAVDREQALRCLTVALLCLQRSPDRRPSIAEVVGMLSGSSETPQLRFQFSPSPPCAFRSRRKAG